MHPWDAPNNKHSVAGRTHDKPFIASAISLEVCLSVIEGIEVNKGFHDIFFAAGGSDTKPNDRAVPLVVFASVLVPVPPHGCRRLFVLLDLLLYIY